MTASRSTRRSTSVSTLARALALGGLVAFGTTAMAGPTNVPFNASVELSETVVFTFLPPCFALGYLNASGTATHLGKVSGTAVDCINPTSAINLSAPMSYRFASTKVVLTGATGEMLYLSYAGTLTAQPTGPHVIAGNFVITGGTGRYTSAAGGGVMSGSEDLSQIGSGKGKATFTGTISY